MKRWLLLVLTLIVAAGATAKVKLPALMGDGMVLQQKGQANIWGWAEPGRKVTVTTSWNGKSYAVTADKDGNWLAAVATPSWGGPYTIDIKEGETVTLRDVMIGEVWICSGQSNMEMPVKGFSNQPVENCAETVLSSGKYSQIRSFWVKLDKAVEPKADCKGEWKVSAPGNVESFSATAYFFARHLTDALGGVPVGIITSCVGGSRLECWLDKPTFDKVPAGNVKPISLESSRVQEIPTILYYGMITPLVNYTARGFIWYQGESNRFDYKLYPKQEAAMVDLWRREWKNPGMPFYCVQIAPYKYADSRDIDAPLMVEAQVKAVGMIPNSGIATTTDVGEELCIHPAKKEPVGQRLAILALNGTYGVKCMTPTGPVYKSVEYKDGKAVVTFDNAPSTIGGLRLPLRGFDIAGADRKFYPAEARVVDGKPLVTVWSADVPSPVAVRYAFRNFIPSSDLYNNYGLPAFPFRTDDWDDVK